MDRSIDVIVAQMRLCVLRKSGECAQRSIRRRASGCTSGGLSRPLPPMKGKRVTFFEAVGDNGGDGREKMTR